MMYRRTPSSFISQQIDYLHKGIITQKNTNSTSHLSPNLFAKENNCDNDENRKEQLNDLYQSQDSLNKGTQLQIITPLVKSNSNTKVEEHYLSDNEHNLKEYDLQYYPSSKGDLLYKMNQNSDNEESQIKKYNEMNKEIGRLKIENNRVLKLREDYEYLNRKLKKELNEFKQKREDEIAIFAAYKEEEIKKLQKERKQFLHELQIFNDNKVKNIIIPSLTKKTKDTIEHLQSQITKLQEESKFKENNSKLTIEKYKKQLEEAHALIQELNNEQETNRRKSKNKLQKKHSQISYSKHKHHRSRAMHEEKINNSNSNNYTSNRQPFLKGSNSSSNTINMQLRPMPSFLIKQKDLNNENNEDEVIDDTFDIVFPDKYHKAEFKLIKQEIGDDGKTTRVFDNNKKEIIYPSGVRKELYRDGYQIIYFNNGDVKQLYPDGKIVYYYSEAKTIQTKFKDHQVFKFENGQIEKHFNDGTIKIAFLDGSLRYILPDGSEETYYLDGRIHKIDSKGVVSLQNEDGLKEILYPDVKEVIDNKKIQ